MGYFHLKCVYLNSVVNNWLCNRCTWAALPSRDVNKHLRPISLTPVLSKVAEEFVVASHLRPSILKKIGDTQFGAIPES